MAHVLMAGAIAFVGVSITTPAAAFYTECTDTDLAIRPGGPTEPRYMKGDKVAYRGEYQGWWFVLHGDTPDYGWLPRSILSNCHRMEGTP